MIAGDCYHDCDHDTSSQSQAGSTSSGPHHDDPYTLGRLLAQVTVATVTSKGALEEPRPCEWAADSSYRPRCNVCQQYGCKEANVQTGYVPRAIPAYIRRANHPTAHTTSGARAMK